MKKLYPFIFSLYALSIQSLAQDTILPTVPKKHIEFLAEGYINSNAITNNFVKAFYYGNYIDDIIKYNSAANLSDINRLGAVSKWGINYTVNPNNASNSPAFSFSFYDRANIDLKFSNDLFETIFYGNKKYAGTTSSLGNFKFRFLRYQQMRFGWDWLGDKTHGSYGFAFSLLSGDQNTYINGLIADLYTAPDGSFLDLGLKMNVDQTDTAHRSFFSQNGVGLSTDFYYELPYLAWKNPGKIIIKVKDLGFIKWKNSSMHYQVDSSFHYEGISVSDIFNLDSSAVSFTVDKALDENTKMSKAKYRTSIPFTLDVHTKVLYGSDIAFEKGIIWLFQTSAKPYIYGKFHFLFGRKKLFDMAYTLGYGGYGKFTSGVDINIDITKHYSLHYVNNFLFSGIVARTSHGMGTYVKLTRNF